MNIFLLHKSFSGLFFYFLSITKEMDYFIFRIGIICKKIRTFALYRFPLGTSHFKLFSL